MSGVLVMPPDVPPQLAGRIDVGSYRGMPYECGRCHRQGQLGAGPPVTVQVHLYVTPRPQILVTYLHTRCGAGGLVEHPAGEAFTVPGDVTSFAVPILVYSPVGAGWPAIAIEIASSVLDIPLDPRRGDAGDDRGDDVDLVIASLCAIGFHPVGNVAFPPQPPDPRWQVILPGRGEPGQIRGPGGHVLFEPLAALTISPNWIGAVAGRDGRCAVYHVARVGLATNLTQRTDPHDGLRLLNRAARDGRVVGVVADVIPGGQR